MTKTERNKRIRKSNNPDNPNKNACALAVAMAELELLKFELAASQRSEIALERTVTMLRRAAGLR